MSDGSGGDIATIDDASFFEFDFTASGTDSLPFTVYDTDRTVTRKSHHVCCYCLYPDVFVFRYWHRRYSVKGVLFLQDSVCGSRKNEMQWMISWMTITENYLCF